MLRKQVDLQGISKSFFTAISLTLLCLAGFSLVACGARVPYFEIMSKNQAYVMSGVVNKKVDILWVIDNSGSMGPKQTNLANSIASFMSQFVSKDMDYHIGVITTDIRAVDSAHPTDPNYSGQDACLIGSPKIITSSTAGATAKLGANAEVGYYGTSYAKGIDAVKLALSAPRVTGCNAGFIRNDAFLAVVFFSDDDDNDSATTSLQLLDFLDSLRPPFVTSTNAKVRSYFLSAMVVRPGEVGSASCNAWSPPVNGVGTKFLSLAGQTSGSTASICDADFSPALLDVSTHILEAATAVQLARIPDESTISVTIDGNAIAKDAVNGWTYDSATNRIFFHGASIPVGGGVIVNVDYTPSDVIR